MKSLLLPSLLGLALLAGAVLGYVTPAQLAAGLGLLLTPGYDRFVPLVREILGRAATEPEVYVLVLLNQKEEGRVSDSLLFADYAEADAKRREWAEAHGASSVYFAGRAVRRPVREPVLLPTVGYKPGGAALLLLFLGALSSCVAPARRNEARATFTAAQQDQVAAAQDLAALDREHQQDLALEIPRAGVARVRLAVIAWRGRRADVLATSERLAREAAEARTTMEGSGDPAELEALAQRAKEGAAQLRAAITGLRAYAAEDRKSVV